MTKTYDVYRDGTRIASGLIVPSYVDTGLVNGVPHIYRVSAVANGLESPQSASASATPSATPGVGPGPTPPTPTGIVVPSGIDATGATDVSAAMQTWVNSQPDGSTLIFPSGSSYLLGAYGIALESRNNLTFWGYGSTLKNHGGSAIQNSCFYTGWGAGNSSGIKIKGFAIQGGNPDGGTTSAYHVGAESAQGFSLYKNAVSWEIADCTITDQWGHAIYVAGGPLYGGVYSTNLNFHNNAIARTGVMGIAVRNGISLTFANNLITDTAICPIDIEDALAGEYIHSIWFLNNVLNRWGWSGGFTPHAIVGDGPGDFNDIRVQSNILQGGSQAGSATPTSSDGYISFWGSAAKGTMLIDANDGSAISPFGWGMRFQSVNGLTVTNNNFAGTSELAHKVSCTSVIQTGNTPA